MTLIEKAEYLTQTKGKISLTFKSGEILTGFSRGIFEKENDDGDYIGDEILFDSNQLEFPLFVMDQDLVAVEVAN